MADWHTHPNKVHTSPQSALTPALHPQNRTHPAPYSNHLRQQYYSTIEKNLLDHQKPHPGSLRKEPLSVNAESKLMVQPLLRKTISEKYLPTMHTIEEESDPSSQLSYPSRSGASTVTRISTDYHIDVQGIPLGGSHLKTRMVSMDPQSIFLGKMSVSAINVHSNTRIHDEFIEPERIRAEESTCCCN